MPKSIVQVLEQQTNFFLDKAITIQAMRCVHLLRFNWPHQLSDLQRPQRPCVSRISYERKASGSISVLREKWRPTSLQRHFFIAVGGHFHGQWRLFFGSRGAAALASGI